MEYRLRSDKIFEGRFLTVYNDTVSVDGDITVERTLVRHPGAVCIAAMDDDHRLWFVKQFRYAVSSYTEELPAGKMEPCESHDLSAARELMEETGFTADHWLYLGPSFPCPGYSDEVIHNYLATDLHSGQQSPDEDERLDMFSLSLEEAVNGVLEGRFPDYKTSSVILMVNELVRRSAL